MDCKFYLDLQDDESAMNFVASAANLRAFAFNIALKSKFDIKCKLFSCGPTLVVMYLICHSRSASYDDEKSCWGIIGTVDH